MKVGIVLNNYYNKNTGGGFAYFDKVVHELINSKFENSIKIIFIILDNSEITGHKFIYLNGNKKLGYYYNVILSKIFRTFNLGTYFTKKANIILANQHEQIFAKNKIDILYYPNPSNNIYNYPYITTCWDLGHKNSYSFPEVSMNETFELRENFCKNVYQKAFAIFCESQAGKDELIFYERINPSRIFILPMIPGNVVNIKLDKNDQNIILNEYGIVKAEYFFYPAQFWSHKNHINLLQAFKAFLNYFPEYKLILSGSDKGNLVVINEYILRNGLSDNVIITGFIPDEHIYTFYINSQALVYPSLIGPTNMPPLEARALGVKVICSNLAGHVEQLNDYPLYFDPLDFNDICSKMIKILDKPNISYDNNINLGNIINSHLISINNIRNTFGLNFDQY